MQDCLALAISRVIIYLDIGLIFTHTISYVLIDVSEKSAFLLLTKQALNCVRCNALISTAKHAGVYLRPTPTACLCYDGNFAVSSLVFIFFFKQMPPVIVQKGNITPGFPDQESADNLTSLGLHALYTCVRYSLSRAATGKSLHSTLTAG